MSGKPASVGAVRAGPPGAPRLLVYVERQLERGAAPPAPPAPLGAPAAHADHRALSDAFFYKHLNDNENKLAGYDPTDNILPGSKFYPSSQQYAKELGLKIEDVGTDRSLGANIKQDSVDSIGGEFCGVETLQCRAPVEPVECVTYQGRCSGALLDSMPMQQVAIRHGQNQYSESVTADVSSERELVGKSFVNYQILEQSVSHQSIVNQSISILNQQVGVSRGGASEGENGNPPQLVRTADGVVLAVVPGPVPPHNLDTDNSRIVTSDSPQTITVPLGWRRIVTGTSVIYISPSGTALSTIPQLREYLQTAGTCKCGLPCPLRPETAFSFDSKVVSKPYQVAAGAELTKLCNHKRKLLATLQATPPPTEQKKAMGTEVAVLKKKMKKRPGFPANVSVSQLMVQRERPLAEFKESEGCELPSAGVNASVAFPAPALEPEPKPEATVQRGSHYLTVNNGWISHHAGDKTLPAHAPVGVPVRGANGQIIGVNTCYKHNYRGNLPPEQDIKDDRKDTPIQHHVPPVKQIQNKEEESQIFCGLNQPLTPEVMQKINEQQQIFIQQNQKQIEMAMKGYRNQLEGANQSKPQGQNQLAPQGQLVIQNGAVVKTNSAKTPPWQVKRNDSMISPNSKLQKLEIVDFEESNATMSEDSSSSFSSFSSNEQGAAQGMCPRVPPLPQHYNMLGQQWPPLDTTKKKGKANKTTKKKNSPVENKMITFGSNGMRIVQDQKGNGSDEMAFNNVPSFMDDPSGYLAQQTVLLNNTISRQVGMSTSYDGSHFDGSNSSNYIQHHQIAISKPAEMPNLYRNNLANSSPSPNTTPDSSVLSDKSADNSQCCKGCNTSSKGSSPEYLDNQMRYKYMKHNIYKMETDGNISASPKHGYDENPVTSSTYIERRQGEGCSPVQAGTVSTSHVGEPLPPPEPSPTPSNGSRGADTPGAYLSSAYGNTFAGQCSQPYRYGSPGPATVSGTQMMHFISNHNVNKNLMEVDNISMVGVKPALRRDGPMGGYCPPPHLGGGPARAPLARYVQALVTTMASGWSVTRDTVTSVLAGRATTATTSVNARADRPRPPPGANLAIPNDQPDPFLDAVNLPTSYPLHIAGTTAQNMISKSPLEMMQNVIGNSPPKSEPSGPPTQHTGKRTTPGQILISSTGQIIVSHEQMPPPPPKATTAVPSSQPAVVVNALPAPFVLQPPMVMEGPAGPHFVADPARQLDVKTPQGYVQGVAMLSPETLKKRSKKKSRAGGGAGGVVQLPAPGGLVVQPAPPASPQYSPRGFQLSPNTLSPAPVLQALTIVPGKSGAPAHIVMSGQGGGATNFCNQQIINTSPSQINLLQPVNLINGASGVVSNFPFQQFIVPNLGGMVMTADGAIIQDGAPVQLQLQTVNGQNVLTPVHGQGVLASGGVVLRPQGHKMMQSQHSPSQFLSPNSQMIVNSPGFNGQLSPLLAGLSPPSVAFAGPRPAQDYIQTNQMGPALMVPVSPKRASLPSRGNSTFVQNTTIVQQQTTLVSNGAGPRLGLHPTLLMANKPVPQKPSYADEKGPEEGEGEGFVRHSVSTQTLAGRKASPPHAGSPPDTTTHSPLGAGALEPERRARHSYADTTTKSPEPADANSSAMVQCVSSSEPDVEARELGWPRPDFGPDTEHNNMMSSMPMMRQRHGAVESSEPYPALAAPPPAPAPLHTDYYERTHTYKRKNDFGDGSTYRSDKIMRTHTYSMLHAPKDNEYDMGMSSDKSHMRHYRASGSSADGSMPKVFERHNLGSSDDAKSCDEGEDGEDESSANEEGESSPRAASERGPRALEVGQVVWGPVRGHASWPGALEARAADGRWRVRWFGGERPPPPALLHPARLLTLSEGLEAHHAARTRHRKSRKLNTLLENAIQEAMSELDKKSEGREERSAEGEGGTSAVSPGTELPIDDTPKRSKKQDKQKAKDKHHKRNPVKIAPNPSKAGDGARLRSAR